MSYELQDKDRPVVRNNPARGYKHKGRSPRVLITFEPWVFGQICGAAQKRKISFASVVRELIDDALANLPD